MDRQVPSLGPSRLLHDPATLGWWTRGACAWCSTWLPIQGASVRHSCWRCAPHGLRLSTSSRGDVPRSSWSLRCSLGGSTPYASRVSKAAGDDLRRLVRAARSIGRMVACVQIRSQQDGQRTIVALRVGAHASCPGGSMVAVRRFVTGRWARTYPAAPLSWLPPDIQRSALSHATSATHSGHLPPLRQIRPGCPSRPAPA